MTARSDGRWRICPCAACVIRAERINAAALAVVEAARAVDSDWGPRARAEVHPEMLYRLRAALAAFEGASR